MLNRLALSKKPDLYLTLWLALQTGAGWVWSSYYGASSVYLWPGTLVLLAGAFLSFFNKPALHRSSGLHRYALIASMVAITGFAAAAMPFFTVALTHTIIVLTFAAWYFEARLISLTVGAYLLLGMLQVKKYENALLIDGDIRISLFLLMPIFIYSLVQLCLFYQSHLSYTRMKERNDNVEKLSKQQHLATIGQIAASIAHDIRNPLTSIQGFIQLIERQERRESYQEYYKIIRSEITRIDSLIREVLVLSKSHTMDLDDWVEVDLADLLQRLVTLMEPDSINSNIQVEINLEAAPVVMGSEEKLHQVFMNMIRNSFEAVVSNGAIRITLGERNGEAVVRIRDTGTGIPENKLEYLFTPFFTTKEEGTGLGLSICQSIIKAHGGDIQARNVPGGGAEFRVSLPKKQALVLGEVAATAEME